MPSRTAASFKLSRANHTRQSRSQNSGSSHGLVQKIDLINNMSR